MNKKLVLVVTCTALIAGFSFGGFTRNKESHDEKGFDSRAYGQMRMLNKLDLTDEQTKKIEDIKDESRIKSIRLKADIEVLEVQFQGKLKDENVKIEDVSPLIDSLAAKRAELMKNGIGSMIEIKNQLTPEQQEKLKGLRKEMMENWMERKSERGKKNKPGDKKKRSKDSE